jgi:hypothetical protein
MKCRYPGCQNKPSRWSRRTFCGEHRTEAMAYGRSMRSAKLPDTQMGDKLRRFVRLKDTVQSTFPRSGRPVAINAAGYEVMVVVPGGLRA